MECNLPYTCRPTEAKAEFAAKKSNFPLECIIRAFLLQKVHANNNYFNRLVVSVMKV